MPPIIRDDKHLPEFAKNSKFTPGLSVEGVAYSLSSVVHTILEYPPQTDENSLSYHQLPNLLKSLIGADSRRNRARREWIEKMDEIPGPQERVDTNHVPHRTSNLCICVEKEPTLLSEESGALEQFLSRILAANHLFRLEKSALSCLY